MIFLGPVENLEIGVPNKRFLVVLKIGGLGGHWNGNECRSKERNHNLKTFILVILSRKESYSALWETPSEVFFFIFFFAEHIFFIYFKWIWYWALDMSETLPYITRRFVRRFRLLHHLYCLHKLTLSSFILFDLWNLLASLSGKIWIVKYGNRLQALP